jgi:hypothetical protein
MMRMRIPPLALLGAIEQDFLQEVVAAHPKTRGRRALWCILSAKEGQNSCVVVLHVGFEGFWFVCVALGF